MNIPHALSRAWANLDDVTARLYALNGEDDLLRGEAFGMAQVISLFYPNLGLDWVRREAVRRYRARRGT